MIRFLLLEFHTCTIHNSITESRLIALNQMLQDLLGNGSALLTMALLLESTLNIFNYSLSVSSSTSLVKLNISREPLQHHFMTGKLYNFTLTNTDCSYNYSQPPAFHYSESQNKGVKMARSRICMSLNLWCTIHQVNLVVQRLAFNSMSWKLPIVIYNPCITLQEGLQ